jgi:hypothetical protein
LPGGRKEEKLEIILINCKPCGGDGEISGKFKVSVVKSGTKR